MNLDVKRRRRSPVRLAVIIAGGLVLGGLLTEVVALLPESVVRQVFVTTVAASLEPVAFDLKVIAIALGPVALRLNVLSAVGVLLVAWFAKSLL